MVSDELSASITPINVAVWALGGFYLSLVPSLVSATTGSSAPLVGGCVVAALTVSGGFAVFTLRLRPVATALRVGVSAMTLGLLCVVAGVHRRRHTPGSFGARHDAGEDGPDRLRRDVEGDDVHLARREDEAAAGFEIHRHGAWCVRAVPDDDPRADLVADAQARRTAVQVSEDLEHLDRHEVIRSRVRDQVTLLLNGTLEG